MISKIGAALKWGKAPLEFLYRSKKKHYKWTRMDYGLAEAYKIFEDERCPQCGTHIWHAHSDDQNIKFEIEEIKCESCVVLDEHNEKTKDKKAGVTPSIKTDVYLEDEPLPTRTDWFVRESEKRKLAQKRKK